MLIKMPGPEEILKKLRGKEEAKLAEEAKEKSKVSPLSLLNVVKDQQHSEVLRIILENEGQNDLRTNLERYLAGETLNEEELQGLFDNLPQYLEKLKIAKENSEKLLEYLTPDRILILGANNQEFRKIVDQLAEKKSDGTLDVTNVRNFLEKYLYRLSVLDPNKFEELNKRLGVIRSAEGSASQAINNMISIAEQYRISSEDLEKALTSKNPEEALEKLIKSRMGILDKAKNFLRGGELLKERLGQFDLNQLEGYNRDVDAALNDVGGIIKEIVTGTDKGRQFFSEAFRRAAGLKKGPEQTTVSFIRAVDDLRNPDDLGDAIREYTKELQQQQGLQINVDDPQELKKWWEQNREKDDVRNGVLGKLQEKKRKKGFLSTSFDITKGFFKAIFEEMLSSFNL